MYNVCLFKIVIIYDNQEVIRKKYYKYDEVYIIVV